MQRPTLIAGCFVFGLVVLCAQQAFAVLVFYSSRAAFDADVGTLSGFESFETVFTPAASVDFGDFTLTEVDGLSFLEQIDQNAPTEAVTDGTRAAGWNGGGGGVAFATMSFDSPINAFGVDVYGRTGGATGDIGRVNVGGDIPDQLLTYNVNGSQFFGLYDPDGSFDEFTFMSMPPDFRPVYLDAVTYGIAAAIPEPVSAALWSLASVCMILANKIRRHSK